MRRRWTSAEDFDRSARSSDEPLPGSRRTSSVPDPSSWGLDCMRWVVYVDMDAFYVACELRDRPDLVGRKVVVGPDPRQGPTRGVVLSASYEARKDGVRSAMPAMHAARLSPDAIWLPANFPKYQAVAEEIRAFLRRRSENVLPMSIDEAALRIEAPTAQDVETWGRNLQQDLRQELKLSGSVGISPFRAVAKIASDRAKPGGLVVVAADRTQEFLSPLSVRVIPGVGPKTQEVLKRIGVETIGDIAKQSAEKLRRTLGTFADELRALARGEPSESDDFVDRGPRSRSVDRTFGEDVSDLEELLAATEHLSSELSEALQTERLRYQTVTIAARWADFTRSQKSQSLTAAHEGRETLWEVGRRLLREILRDEAGRGRRGVRTLSVRVERLVPALAQYPTLESFDTASSGRIKRALE